MPKVSSFFNKYVVFVSIALLYLLFPTSNSTLDSYVYAAYVKYNHYLFTPHHLFSNALIYVLIKPLHFLGFHVDILLFSKWVNSIFQIINLYILYHLLGLLKLQEKTKLYWVLFLAFSFSLWRYGTENEAYIVPITFSLLGSLYLLKFIYKQKSKYILLSGLYAAVACLFHQIHFFWWVGLLVGVYLYSKQFKTLVVYILPALLVPVSYVLVLFFYEHQSITIFNLQHFVLHDFYQGSVDTNFGWKAVFFQVLNTVRTFVQIHPNIYLFIKHNSLYIIPLLVSAVVFAWAVWQLKKRPISLRRADTRLRVYLRIHIGIALANYLFAFYNYGNVEFMVMLPYLLVLCVSIMLQIQHVFLQKIVILLFVWNFFYAIIPNYIYNYYNDIQLVNYMLQHPNQTFVIKNPEALNQYVYASGRDNPENITLINKLSDKELQQLIIDNKTIYTDIIDKPELLNKQKMTAKNHQIDWVFFKREKVLSYNGFYGTSTIYKISTN